MIHDSALMQDSRMQLALQPYVKLVQSNMELLGKYLMSPEAATRRYPSQGRASPSSLTQSNALTELVRGTIKNCTEFSNEVGERGIALLAQGQAALVQQTEQATRMARNAATGRASG